MALAQNHLQVNSLTTINGSPYIVISNGLVKKLGQNLDSCAKACLEETAIRCQFFKFVNNTGTCFLSDADNADIQKRIADDIADTNKGKHKDFTSASGNKFEDVHENHHTLSDVVDPELQDTHRSHHQNKPSRLIYSEEPYKLYQRHRAGNGGKSRRNHKQSDKGRQTKIHRQIKKKIRKMNSKLNKVEKHLKRLMKIKGDTEDLKDAIKEKTRSTKDLLKNDRKENKIMKKIKRKLNSLGKKSEDITEELVSLKQTQDTLSKHLMKVEKSGVHLGQTVNMMKASNGRLEKSIKSLKKDDSEMNNRTSTVQSKVESVKAQLDSLTNLTSALNLSEANLSKNQWRAVSAIGKYAKMTKDIDQKYVGLRLKMKHVTRELGNSESGRKTLKDNVKEVKKKLKTIQRTVSRSKDPMNSNKRHRQRELNWLKNELSNLRSRSKNIKRGVRRSKNEMSDIRRQMNKVKLFKEDMEDKFESLQQTSKQLNVMVKTVQKDMSSPKYRVKMAKLESKMKNALETLKYRERSIHEKLKGFSERMDKLRKQIRWRSNIKGIWRYIRDIKIKKKALLASLENTKSISKVEILRLRKSQHDLEQRLRKLKQKTRKVTKDMMSKSELHKRINNAIRKLDRFWWRKKMAMNTKMMKEYRKNEREKKRLMRELKEIKTVYHKVLKSFRKPPEEQLLKVEVCPRHFTLRGRSCFSKLRGRMDYRHAFSQCRRRKANLVTDTSFGDMRKDRSFHRGDYWLSAYSSMRGRYRWKINNKRIHGSTFRMGRFHRNQRNVCIWMNSGRRRLWNANCRHRHQVVCVRNPVRERKRPQRRKGRRRRPKRKSKKNKVVSRNIKRKISKR